MQEKPEITQQGTALLLEIAELKSENRSGLFRDTNKATILLDAADKTRTEEILNSVRHDNDIALEKTREQLGSKDYIQEPEQKRKERVAA